MNTHAVKSALLELFPIGPEIPDHRRMDPVSAVMGGVGAVTNVIGGITGRSAAKDAAKIQQKAAQQAGQQVVDTTAQVNPQIGEAAERAAAGVEAAGAQANQFLDPYADLGTAGVNALTMRLPELTKQPTMADLEIDPGFAFRLSEGMKAVENSAAARGGLLSGATIKATERYAQGLASDEYQKAFDRYRASTGDIFSRLSSLVDRGTSVAGQQGSNVLNTAQYGGNIRANAANTMASNTINAARAQGEYLTEGANAEAAGIVGGANALNQGLSGAAGSGMNALALYELRRPRSTANSGTTRKLTDTLNV